MGHLEYWDCDRCGKNTKDDKQLDIFTIRATPIVHVAAVATEARPPPSLIKDFELCAKCLRDFLGDWGKDFLQ
jgi:ribosomal protein S26